MIERKLVVVGDGGCGKTSLLARFSTGDFPTQYVPTIFETSCKDLDLPGDIQIEKSPEQRQRQSSSQSLRLSLWDTAGQEEFDRLRPLTYPGTSVVLLCFAIDSPPSLDNVVDRWLPELRHFLGAKVPVVLVATKTDLRDNPLVSKMLGAQGQTVITKDVGEKVATVTGCVGYAEASARNDDGVDNVFELAIRASLAPKVYLHRRRRSYMPIRSGMPVKGLDRRIASNASSDEPYLGGGYRRYLSSAGYDQEVGATAEQQVHGLRVADVDPSHRYTDGRHRETSPAREHEGQYRHGRHDTGSYDFVSIDRPLYEQSEEKLAERKRRHSHWERMQQPAAVTHDGRNNAHEHGRHHSRALSRHSVPWNDDSYDEDGECDEGHYDNHDENSMAPIDKPRHSLLPRTAGGHSRGDSAVWEASSWAQRAALGSAGSASFVTPPRPPTKGAADADDIGHHNQTPQLQHGKPRVPPIPQAETAKKKSKRKHRRCVIL
ncbi:aldehyde dehydrogenase 3, member A2 [Savitreella phatthalungensis]